MSGLDDLLGGLAKAQERRRRRPRGHSRRPARRRKRVGRVGRVRWRPRRTSSAACSAAGRRSGSERGEGGCGVNIGAIVGGARAARGRDDSRAAACRRSCRGSSRQGMGAQADSWVSTGEQATTPVSGSDMRVGLGDDTVRAVRPAGGDPRGRGCRVLATVLPQVVNGVSPNGRLPSNDELDPLVSKFGG